MNEKNCKKIIYKKTIILIIIIILLLFVLSILALKKEKKSETTVLTLSSDSGELYVGGLEKEIEIDGNNYGELSCSTTDDKTATCTIVGNKLIIEPKETAGSGKIIITESKNNKRAVFDFDVKKTELVLKGSKTIVSTPGKNIEVDIDGSNIDEVLCKTMDSSIATCKIENSKLVIIPQKKAGETVVTLKEKNGNKTVIINVTVNPNNETTSSKQLETSIKLSETSGVTYVGGKNLQISISGSNMGNLSCDSMDEDIATCKIENSKLIVIPKNKNGIATITVRENKKNKAITYNANVKKTSVILEKNKKTIYIDNSYESSITGLNYGTLSCSSSNKLVSCEIKNNKLIVKPKKQEGKAIVTVTEDNGNAFATLELNIKEMVLNLNESSGVGYTGGEFKEISITGKNYGDLSCSVSDANIASCQIDNNKLIIKPFYKTGKTIVTVKENNIGKEVHYELSVTELTTTLTISKEDIESKKHSYNIMESMVNLYNSDSTVRIKANIVNNSDEYISISRINKESYDNNRISYEIKKFDITKDFIEPNTTKQIIIEFSWNDYNKNKITLNSQLEFDFGIMAPNYLKKTTITDNFLDIENLAKDKIESIKFVNHNDVPDDAIASYDVSELNNGSIMTWYYDKNDNGLYELYVGSFTGMVLANPDSSYLFYQITNLKKLDLTYFSTKDVTNMASMFSHLAYNSSTIELNFGNNFYTEKVQYMNGMFSNTCNRCTQFQLTLPSTFNTKNVLNMSSMFSSCGEKSTNFTLDLGDNFITNKVSNMTSLFSRVGYSNVLFELDLGEHFNTSNVTEMNSMFFATGYNSSIFTLDLGENFDTSRVETMREMFYGTGKNSNVFTLNLKDKFNTSRVRNMGYMFTNVGYKSPIFTLNLGNKFNTSNVTTMISMFNNVGYNNENFTLDLGDLFYTSKVTNMYGLFENTGHNSTVFTLDLGNKFNTSNVTTMCKMFYATGSKSPVFTLNLGRVFYTKNVGNFSDMFSSTGYSSQVFTLDLGNNFDTSAGTTFINMFSNTGYSSPVFTLNLGNKFNTSNGSTMEGMFKGTGYNSKVYSLNLGKLFTLKKATSMKNMFYGYGHARINDNEKGMLDLSNVSFSHITDFEQAFAYIGNVDVYMNASSFNQRAKITWFANWADYSATFYFKTEADVNFIKSKMMGVIKYVVKP